MKKSLTAIILVLVCILLIAALMVILRYARRSGGTGEVIVHTIRLTDEEEENEPRRPFYGPADPPRAEPADESYFADAAFVGTDTVTALGLYDYNGLLSEADFFPVDTLTEEGCLDGLLQGSYGKVYIGVGPEELIWHLETLSNDIRDEVRQIKKALPDAVIYLMSMTPVSKYVSSTRGLTTQERVEEFNEKLLKIAQREEVYYLDVCGVLCDEEGYLPSEVTENGTSFTPAHYEAWYDLISTHYVNLDPLEDEPEESPDEASPDEASPEKQ